MHLELSLLVVFGNAVILAGSSVEAAANTQDRTEQGAGELVADPDSQLHRLGAEGSPRQVAITWSGKHKGCITALIHQLYIILP